MEKATTRAFSRLKAPTNAFYTYESMTLSKLGDNCSRGLLWALGTLGEDSFAALLHTARVGAVTAVTSAGNMLVTRGEFNTLMTLPELDFHQCWP